MVIVIMDDVESRCASVAALLAESLGWEFLDIEKHCTAITRGAHLIAENILRLESLNATLDTCIFQWRDVVISCPVLTDKDQRHLRHNRSLVKFVHLKANDGSGSIRPQAADQPTFATPADASGLIPKYDGVVLTLASSLERAEIVNAVITGIVLQSRSCKTL